MLDEICDFSALEIRNNVSIFCAKSAFICAILLSNFKSSVFLTPLTINLAFFLKKNS